jgi:hypothetical protein
MQSYFWDATLGPLANRQQPFDRSMPTRRDEPPEFRGGLYI